MSRMKQQNANNVIFDQIRQSIASRVNPELNEWSKKYSWDCIKLTAHELMLERSTMENLSPEEASEVESVKQKVNAYSPSNDRLTDRQNKYSALLSVMKSSSFKQLRSCLERLHCDQP